MLKSYLQTAIISLFFMSSVQAQTDSASNWKIGGILGSTFSQTYLSNWAAGGENSLSITSIFNIYFNYSKKEISWDNSFNIGYGTLKQGDSKKYRKTDDKFEFSSKFGYEAYKNLYYSAFFSFKTQMAKGYNYPNDSIKISDFLAPAYLIGSIGVDFKQNFLSVFFSPLTFKVTLVQDKFLSNNGAFGVKPGKKSKEEFGGFLKANLKVDNIGLVFFENVGFISVLELFSNYQDNPENIDVSWENILAFKINKFLSLNFIAHVKYDDNIIFEIDNNKDGIIDKRGPRTQFKEILGIGISYNF